MERANDDARGSLAALQDVLVDGGKTLAGQAFSLGAGLRRRLAAVSHRAEGPLPPLFGAVEEILSERLGMLASGLAAALQWDIPSLRERVSALEHRLLDMAAEVRALAGPIQAVAGGAREQAAEALARGQECSGRIRQLEERVAALRHRVEETRGSERVRQRLEAVDRRLDDLCRQLAAKPDD